MMRTLTLTLLLIVTPAATPGQGNRYFTLNTTKVRPLAMGSAFTALGDALAAIQFNPAAYFPRPNNAIPRLTLFLNPVSPVVGGVNHEELFRGSGSLVDDTLLSLSLLLKSISVNLNSVQLGFLLGEEGLYLPEMFFDERFVRVSGFRQNHTHSLIGRLQLADEVSVGASANFLFGSAPGDPMKRRSDFGISYGILLRPEKGLNIGVSFVNLPDSLADYRLPLERLVDESVNIGVAYEMFTKTLVSLDVRNLGEESNRIIRELHLGVEQLILTHLALRAGYFKKNSGEHVLSWGVGLLNDTLLFNSRNESSRNFYLNYAFVYEKSQDTDTRWHFLSFLIKI